MGGNKECELDVVEKGSLGELRKKWYDNIKMDARVISCEDRKRMQLAANCSGLRDDKNSEPNATV
jgi:hypothetical protein